MNYKKMRSQLVFEVLLCRLLGAGYGRRLPMSIIPVSKLFVK